MGIIYKNGIPYGNQPPIDATLTHQGEAADAKATGDEIGDVKAMIETSVEESATSAHAYAVGEHFIYNDTLYRATAAIAIGDTITPDTNCVATNVMTEVESGGGGGGGTSDYTQLSNKPQINGVTLTGNKSLSDIGAASQSDLEALEDITGDGALSGFTATDLTGAANELKNTLNTKADQDDLASLNLTGTTNTTGSQINAGTYFYLSGALVKAKVDIASGATFTSGTNYETVTAGGLNDLNSKFINPPDIYHSVKLQSLESSVSTVITSIGGWYSVVAITRGDAGSCAAYITSVDATKYYATAYAPPDTYQRATTAWCYFPAGVQFSARAYYTHAETSGLFFANPL
jgi:hypothetical protein